MYVNLPAAPLVLLALCAVSLQYGVTWGWVPVSEDDEEYMGSLLDEVIDKIRMEERGGAAAAVQRSEGEEGEDEDDTHSASIWGHQYMQGGAGEGFQRLRPEGSIPNPHQVKSDARLPAYCNPPNPCPKGYTSEKRCLEDMPNEADYVRDYQAKQDCMCDKEHMISCNSDYNGDDNEMITNAIQEMMGQGANFAFDGQHIGLVAKKGSGWKQHNPYLGGEALPVAAKKGIGY